MRDSCQEILRFWFEETAPSLWYQNNASFDREIKSRFLLVYRMAQDGLCDAWSDNAEGALALCLIFDQFPRRMFRGSPKAYETGAKALAAAKKAIAKGYDQIHPPTRRRFFYLPFLHSEKLSDQERSVILFEKIREDDPPGYENAIRARDIVKSFGRFPERNEILGRVSTPEEKAYLARRSQSA